MKQQMLYASQILERWLNKKQKKVPRVISFFLNILLIYYFNGVILKLEEKL
jgi:hypothetical protein